MPAEWELIRDECQARRRDAIPATLLLSEGSIKALPKDRSTVVDHSGHFTDAEISIINTPAREIVAKIKAYEWSAETVTRAFCKSAAVAQQLTNCLTEVFFDDAIQRAKFLDKYQRENNKTIGPLHGLPISLKDSFFLAPFPSSIAVAAFARKPVRSTAPLAKVMQDLGAVFYVKTNVPVGMMGCETINNVWGEATNPWGFTPGGSSGGEGALVSMKGSPLGIGTDLGGSVRLPAGWCGLYGFKASALRMSMRGHRSPLEGVDLIKGTCGPLARCFDTVEFWLELITSEPRLWELDNDVVPMPWRSQDDRYKNRKLRIGVIKETDGLVTVHPPIARALDLVIAALEAEGHEVFDWKPRGHKEMSDLMLKNTFSHGKPVIEMVTETGEPLLPTLAGFKAAYEGSGEVFTAETQRVMSATRDRLRNEYFDAWAATATELRPEMDAILTPLSPWVMPPLKALDRALNLSFTNFANVLDAPACVLPVTFVDKNVDKKRTSFNPLNDMDATIQADYEPELYDGVPVCIQLVGKRLQEEQLVAVAKKIDLLMTKEKR
ncbi:hypothetical protein B0A52_05276 [Exophiala mesophila]|uniref:amidase n=1 Tax=Exophiala mesophila TaxID=212818 RepID=A0A438N4G7_EXOME|nr:hypothetical protein B0A52_05276 [Exophiala mesophila]